ncbi:peptidase domain-containing ABC transporter [Lactococcus piscium]|uniref:ABC transporter permease n=1 Tax=Pseudolactococcus paracarnosus TaxID=2749962 RepID=A0A7L4WD63_9LACT|nr:peptidase domain-containing ABC transporter [Lactococcus paracarnosus]MCJ1993964.1 peptidase domain-containing ABC transporter [Lactococcus paracarnosus]QDJ28127.1 ABC transporter permease [Lactococcus paracarnosus]SPC35484.1 Bacteriocin system ABC transporter peptidase/permease/ATP-binding protein [Lactococcus piscium]
MLDKQHPVILQHDASDCAAAVMSSICRFYGEDYTLMKMREVLGTDIYGTTVSGLVTGATRLGFDAKAIKMKVEDVTQDYTLPAILHVRTVSGATHFIVVYQIKKDNLFVMDPAFGYEKRTRADIEKIFTGVAILMIPKSKIEIAHQNKTSMWHLFKQIMMPQKKILATVILMSAVLTILGIVSSLFSKAIFDEVIPYQLKNTLFVYMTMFLLIGFIQFFLSWFRSYVLLFLSRKIDLPVLLGYYNHVLRLPYHFFSTRKTGDILTRFQDAMSIKDIFSQVSVSLVLDLLLAILTGIALIQINLPLFLLTLSVVIIDVLLIYVFKGSYKRINYDQMEAGAVMNSQLIESIQNIETVKAYGNETVQIDKLENKFVKVLKLGYSEGLLSQLQSALSSGINNMSTVVMMAVGALAIIDGKLSIGDLMVFQTLSGYFTQPIQNLVGLQLTYQEAQIAMVRLGEMMELDTEISAPQLLTDVSLTGDIHFDNVSFRYGSRPPVIEGLNLTIKSGSKLAIVGESGSGKSSLAKLLMKFYDVSKGAVRFDTYDLADMSPISLRSKIGYVPQNIELFTGTILDNVKIGDDMATYEQVLNAVKMAGAYDFISKLPQRLYAFVEENGANFSGGERQRIALARAFLKQRDLYIFDESTSNLDSFSELKIQRALEKATAGKTTIMIAHRLSTIVASDLIIFMSNGKIIEQGTHDALLSQDGQYARIIRLQYGGQIVAGRASHKVSREGDGDKVSY